MADNSPVIEMQSVNKWFGDFHVLRDINLNVARGERIVICGPSGSGKSTMIRCINRLEEHQVRLHRERAHDRDALLLSAGEPVRIVVRLVGETEALEQFERTRPGLGARELQHARGRERHVP